MRVPSLRSPLSSLCKKRKVSILTHIALQTRTMATVKDHLPHTIRTAADPRQTGLFNVTVSRIEQVNSKIRLLRLSLPTDGSFLLRHLPGQYLDVRCPHIPQEGGFTITSPPSTATSKNSYVELAIQSSTNPPALHLWSPPHTLLNSPLIIRVGGSFIYPPATLPLAECAKIDRAVFIAGGVGINPIMSMLSAMQGRAAGWVGGMVREVRVLYTTQRLPRDDGGVEEVLFEKRLDKMVEGYKSGHAGDRLTPVDFRFTLFETTVPTTGSGTKTSTAVGMMKREYRRITHEDLIDALGPEDKRGNTVAYVCGPPAMTDDFVEFLKKQPGMEDRRILCEKWW